MNKQGKKRLISLVVTLTIISVLLFSGPVRALTLGITDLVASITEQNNVSFLAKADIHTNDALLNTVNFTVNISDSSGNIIDTCIFDINGASLICSSNITVSRLSAVLPTAGYDYGYTYGYGYDYSAGTTSTKGTNFSATTGYGYAYSAGYGYDSFNTSIKTGLAASTAELIYNITWATPDVSSNTDYTVSFTAYVTDGTNQFRYESTAANEGSIQVNATTSSGDDSNTTDTDSSSSSSTTTPTTTPTQTKVSKKWNTIIAGEETTMNIANDAIPLLAIVFTTLNNYDNVELEVSTTTLPANIPSPSGTIYQILDIDSSNLPEAGIDEAKIKFKIPLIWFEDNDLDPFTVRLMRYNNGWQELETTITNEDSTYIYFESITPGFSYFVITAEKKIESAETTTEETTAETTTEETTAEETQEEDPKSSLAWLWWTLAIVVIAAAITIYLTKSKRPKKKK